MEVGVPNSFIPHDATTPTAVHNYDDGGGLSDLLLLLAIVLVVSSLALAAGCYLYLQYLNNQSATMKAEIKTAQAAFDPTLVKQLTRLDARLNTANSLLNQHIAPSAFFTVLNQTTLSTVSFQTLTLGAADPNGVTLQMSGVARDINSVALQADIFGKSGVITNAIFSGIGQQADGVHFVVTGKVTPAAINYAASLSGQAASGVNQLPASSSTVDPTTPTTPASNSPAVAPATQPTP